MSERQLRKSLDELPGGRLQEWMDGVREENRRRKDRQQRFVWKGKDMVITPDYPKNHQPIKSPYFWIFSEGGFPGAGEISVKVVDTARLVPEDLQAELDKKWESYPGKKWPNDDKLSRYRFEGIKVIDETVTIYVSPTISYKDCITWCPELTEQHGLEAAPHPIAATTLIKTFDRKLILTRRNSSHDYKPGGLSGAGGIITIKEDARGDGSPDIVRALGREVEEETGLKPTEVNSTLKGVFYNPVSGTVNFGFVSTTQLTSDEVKQRLHDTENELLFVDITPETIQNLVLTKTNAFTTEILALLISLGEETFNAFDERWVEDTREIFRLRGISYTEAIKRGSEVVKKLENKDINKS